ncbi:MAG: N-acetylneuraminate synthase family protein [Candidatus Peribacteraceae bacterium]|nr:N-acetylneuraminate synthase family protein [Candidatus Peribacteraceae bacterium]
MNGSPIVSFSGQVIGVGHPCFIIAEACDNHLGDTDTAKRMIEEAKRAGASAVKFQHHLVDAEMLQHLPMSENFQKDLPLYDFLKRYSLTLDQHRELKKYAEEVVGITYMCTPFSYTAAAELHSLDISSFKIGSGEMTDVPSLVRIAAFGKPMIVSTGMSDFSEIDRTYNELVAIGIPFALLHCVSEYPPVYEDINLDVLTIMRDRYPQAVIGFSDHTPDLYTSFAAVTLGAAIVEKHVILDKDQPGPDQSVSISFEALASLVDGIRKIEKSRGNRRIVHRKEAAVRQWAFRYVVTEQSLKAGQIISPEMIGAGMIWTKRTGHPDGIQSIDIQKLVGATVVRNIPPNTPLFWRDVRLSEQIQTS